MASTNLADHESISGAASAKLADGWTIQLENGVSFPCARGDTLLRAALREGIGFPYECNSGGCASCMFELREGAVDEVWDNPPGLTATSREKGRLLACQCVPVSDCTIQVRTRPQYVPLVKPSRQDTVIEEMISLTHDMSLFRLRASGPAVFLPGQFAMLSLPGQPFARAYSMCNLGNERGDWDFIIKRVPGGAFTNTLFNLKPGEPVGIDGPYGAAFCARRRHAISFVLPVGPACRQCFRYYAVPPLPRSCRGANCISFTAAGRPGIFAMSHCSVKIRYWLARYSTAVRFLLNRTTSWCGRVSGDSFTRW